MGQRDAGGGVQNFPMIGRQAAFGQDQARVAMGETGQSVADQQGLAFGQIEGGEPIAEEIEHAGDSDSGVAIAQGRERRLKSDASGIPQGGVGITGVFGEEGDAGGRYETLAAGVWMAFVALAAEDDQIGSVELSLKALPVGVVAQLGWHGAVGRGNLAVSRNDGVSDDMVRH